MATYGEIGSFWLNNNTALHQRFLGGCMKAAFDVSNESGGTTNHVKRLAWANVILSGTEADCMAKVSQMMRYALASNSTLQAGLNAVTDNDIAFIIASQIDALNP
jgi:hypothetical protein